MKKAHPQYWHFTFRKRQFRVLLDKVLLFRYLKRLQGRFWGMAAILGMALGFSVCFLIRPDLLHISTAFSDFGNDIRTAPYFAGSVFFAAYGLWRWRNYLSHSWHRQMPVTGLVTLTIVGLYLVALMPLGWRPWPYYIHIFGITLAGTSMGVTVIIDTLLSRTGRRGQVARWRAARAFSFVAIISGAILTFGSADIIAWYDMALLGELLLLIGYGMWIVVRTYQGEGTRTLLSKFLKDFVLVD